MCVIDKKRWDGSAEQRGDPKFFDLFDIFGDIQIYRFGVLISSKTLDI
jgi:hypothetical protein